MAEPVRIDTAAPDPPAPRSATPEPSLPRAVVPLPDREVPTPDRWQELTQLILGPERSRLTTVEKRLADPGLGVDAVTEVLPEALHRRSRDGSLGTALGPVVGEAIKTSVRRDPQPIVDAIFPVIGPAIRRSIAAAFAEMVQSINTTLEHSFSPRGIAWRIEAWRTGRSFGEVVLSHSLVYRVEQLFLVHRDTGLLIAHRTAPGVKALSPDMVAGMMTALGDFARDTFEMSVQDGLDSFALGELTVWVERGPSVMLASVIRGSAPVAYRETMQRAVEGVQRAHSAELETFARDGTSFDVREDFLESCLSSQLQQTSTSTAGWRFAALSLLVLGLAAWFAIPRLLEMRRFNHAVTALRQEPGVVVGSTGRENGRYVVSGLRDPLARDPSALFAAQGLDSADVSAHWEPYVALRPEFVLRRAQAALQPPATAQLVMRGDTLAAGGIASAQWRASALRLAPALAGVGALDLASLRDSAEVALRAASDRVEQFAVTFHRGAEFPAAGYRAVVDSMSAALRSILDGAAVNNRTIQVEVRASTDSIGTESTNASLRLSRARVVRSLLMSRGIPPQVISVTPDTTVGIRSASLRVAIRPITTP